MAAVQQQTILGFDTSGPYCAAALLVDGEVVDKRAEPMQRGQAERLMPFLEALLTDAGKTWQDLSAIGVGVGPGNFTGIRISVSAARGLALGLDIPAVGVSGFDARSQMSPGQMVAIPAPRDQAYVADPEPRLVPISDLGLVAPDPDPADLAVAIARLAVARALDAPTPPAPLYVRPADAAPPRDAPPVILDG